LIVYDISNIYAPEAICEVQLTGPRGLAVDYDKKMLFVCDGPSGIKALDITNPRGVKLLYSALSLPGVGRIDSYDCMVRDGRLIVVGSSGIYQMGYDHERFTFISKIDIRKRQ
jgi:hypothetical protein